MTKIFKKLMLEQIQEKLNPFVPLLKKPVPKIGWIKTIRKALGLSSTLLAKHLNCSQANIITIEEREKKQTITLETLGKVAKALNCKLVYCLIPIKPLNKQLKERARLIAKKRIAVINHSMQLEQQSLTLKQLQQQENDLVKELLQGNSKRLWDEN